MSPPARARALIQTLAVVMIAPPVAIGLAIPWLRQQPDDLVFLLTGIAATLTVLASVAIAVLQDRQIDEWQRSNARFSSQWGWTVGASLLGLLLALPAVRDLIVSGAAIWGGMPNPDARLVVTTFTVGFVAVIVIQAACTFLLSLGWQFWMSRSARDPS